MAASEPWHRNMKGRRQHDPEGKGGKGKVKKQGSADNKGNGS